MRLLSSDFRIFDNTDPLLLLATYGEYYSKRIVPGQALQVSLKNFPLWKILVAVNFDILFNSFQGT